jgi:arylsulfatase A-like enzyme
MIMPPTQVGDADPSGKAMGSTTNSSAIIIAVDGLPAAYLGTYGNAWLPTPVLDQLASQSLVVEFPWADSLHRQAFATSAFFGRHARCPIEDPLPGIGALLRDAHIDSLLLTDDDSLVSHAGVLEFTDCELIGGELIGGHRPNRPAEEIESTITAQFMTACAERITRMHPSSLVWLQYRGLLDCWDAPLQLRELLADESDPDPPKGIDPIQRVLLPDDDPDLVLGALQAFAAQVAVVDACLAVLLEAIDEHLDPQETLVILTASHGYAVGEHGLIGYDEQHLFEELLHVPLLIRTPASLRNPTRSQACVQPPGLFGILADWFGVPNDRLGTGATSLPANESSQRMFTRAVTVSSGRSSLRVPAWFLVTAAGVTGATGVAPVEKPCQLFAKPDDRWDVNDVAALCPQIVAQMLDQLRDFERAAEQQQLHQLPDLPVELLQPHR